MLRLYQESSPFLRVEKVHENGQNSSTFLYNTDHMAQRNYSDWSREQLIEELEKLKKRKKFGIVWEDKPEDVVVRCKNELPILEEVKDKAIVKGDGQSTNLFIEGDNYHALSVLNYTHARKIDLIYIDPPYNTGAKDWKYNNNYVDENDAYRHSKWLSMMNNRLRLAKNLLKKDGVLICTIDKNENATLLMLLIEIFPGHDVTSVVIEHNPKGLPSRNFSYSHEYAHFVIPKGLSLVGKNPETKVDTRNLRRAGRASYRSERPTMFYPIYVKDGKVVRIGSIPDKTFHPGKRAIFKDNGEIEVYPIDDRGKERRWHFGLDSIEDHLERIEVKYSKEDCQLYVTAVPARYKTVWTGGDLDAGKYGTTLVKNIIGVEFPFPKSLYATSKTLETILHSRKDAIVLDFFAGSGTTAHAVIMMNKKYQLNHQFIICTNNENGIAEQICYPRINKVIKGVEGLSDITGFPTNLRYYKTGFVPAKQTDKNKLFLVSKSTEMLCLKEDCHELIKKEKHFKLFNNGRNKYLGIIYDDEGIEDFKNEVKKLGKRINTYVFSLDDSAREEEFEDVIDLVELKPIPEVILNVYRRIFK